MMKKQQAAGSRPMWATEAAREPEFEKMPSGTPIQCQFCVGQTFRRSHLRAGDIPQLLMMRYPVRCACCSQRQSVSFTVAAVSIPSHIKHRHRPGSSGSTGAQTTEPKAQSSSRGK